MTYRYATETVRLLFKFSEKKTFLIIQNTTEKNALNDMFNFRYI